MSEPKREFVKESLSEEFHCGTFCEIREYFDTVERNNPDFINFEVVEMGSYGGGYFYRAERLENDVEYATRVAKLSFAEQKAIVDKENLQNKERTELARLKKKYELDL